MFWLQIYYTYKEICRETNILDLTNPSYQHKFLNIISSKHICAKNIAYIIQNLLLFSIDIHVVYV